MHPTLSKALLAFLALLAPLSAQSPGRGKAPRFSVELDPATFAWGGYSAHVRFQPEAESRWIFGAGAYALDFPKAMVDLDPQNRNEGWEVRLKSGAGLFADRFFQSGGEGTFAGLQVAAQRFRVENPRLGPGSADYTMGLAMARIGYLWKPAKSSGFYVMPWAGLGWTRKLSGDTTLGGEVYHLSPAIAFATLHAGWRF